MAENRAVACWHSCLVFYKSVLFSDMNYYRQELVLVFFQLGIECFPVDAEKLACLC